MLLLDHFRQPLSVHHPWQSIHSAWANAIVRHLNEDLLPERFYALPNVQPGGRLEIDVATLDRSSAIAADNRTGTAVWAPTAPTLIVPVAEAEFDVFEVQVLNAEDGRLVAAVELVSPANKDRPETRRAFAVKCAALLRQDVSVALIDVVARRGGQLHGEILTVLQASGLFGTHELSLSAIEYRLVRHKSACNLETWLEELRVGSELPVLPIWLEPDFAVPLDLDQTYSAMCQSLRLHD